MRTLDDRDGVAIRSTEPIGKPDPILGVMIRSRSKAIRPSIRSTDPATDIALITKRVAESEVDSVIQLGHYSQIGPANIGGLLVGGRLGTGERTNL